MHHCTVDLKLPDLPLRPIARLDGRAAVDGISAEGHPGALTGQTVKT